MSASWVGSVVSIDCGDVLGTYQGYVKDVNGAEQTLSISRAYRNGLTCKLPVITLNACDIKDLKILKSPEEAKRMPQIPDTPEKSHTELLQKENKRRTPTCNRRINNATPPQGRTATSPRGGRIAANVMHMNGGTNSHTGTPSKPKEEAGFRRRTNSESSTSHVNGHRETAQQRRTGSQPRKIQTLKQPGKSDCFSAPMDSFLDDFDFEKNLALFDKQAVFEEIENSCSGNEMNAPPVKYRCDENVLKSGPTVFRQIQLPEGDAPEYVTDSGLVVPCMSYELRSRLFATAEKLGFSLQRQTEMVGRSACEMVMTLLGGGSRLNPQNSHQKPSVVVLCGPHRQGAQAVNCARQLANHNVQVTLFVPNFIKMIKELTEEIQLFELTGGKRASKINELPKKPVDIIINAMDTHDNSNMKVQTWYTSVVEWTNQSKAQVIAIDPPVEGSTIGTKWSLSLAMPLNLSEKCGQIYLCDIGLPKKVFKEVGVKYLSPFGHKFLIPLHKPQS
ncbi:unnamed protein product [Owenia fusiformis]|uniref:Enhancer of mRNA-decapping protein 3 n=1 Tax=Owenia fusiformis TaxID=6347 RepID=A0A8J1TX43_OWEFU|nr:unnamed protein product [Owenia fusiformis]